MTANLKSIVSESQRLLEEGSFGKSLKLAKDAIAACSPPEARLYLLAGNAAIGAKDYQQAVELLTKASEIDNNLMQPLVKLCVAFQGINQWENVVSVKKRQIEIVQAKGNEKKAVEFLVELAYAQEQAKMFSDSLETHRILIEKKGFQDEILLRSFFRVQYNNLVGNISMEFVEKASVAFIKAALGAGPSRFTIVDAFKEFIGYCDDFALLKRFCFTAREVCKDVLLENDNACAVWCISSSMILFLSQETGGSFSPEQQVIDLAIEVVKMGNGGGVVSSHEYLTQVQWRSWLYLAQSFMSWNGRGEARKCSDLAVLLYKQCTEHFTNITKSSAQQSPVKKGGGTFTFGGAPKKETPAQIAEKERKIRVDAKHARDELLLKCIACVSSALWEGRTEILLHWYVQGSQGLVKDALSANRCVKEGLTAVEMLAQLGGTILPLKELEEAKRRFLRLGLEGSSLLIPTNGDSDAKAFHSKLGQPQAGDEFFLSWYALFVDSGDVNKEIFNKTALEGDYRSLLALTILYSNKHDWVNAEACAKRTFTLMLKVDSNVDREKCTGLLKQLGGLKGVPKTSLLVPFLLTLRGHILLEMGRQDDSLKYLLKSAQMDPTIGTTFFDLGRLYHLKKDDQRSTKCFEKAFKLDPLQPELLKTLQRQYAPNKQFTLLLGLYEQVISGIEHLSLRGSNITIPKFAEAHLLALVGLGRLQLIRKEFPEAASSFQRVLTVDENNIDGWQGLGDAYLKMGRFTAAVKSFETSARLDNVQNRKAYSLFSVGRIYYIVHEYQQSITALSESYALNPTPASSWALALSLLSYSRTLVRAGRYEYAFDTANKALDVLCSVHAQTFSSIDQVRGELQSLLCVEIPVYVVGCVDTQKRLYQDARRSFSKVIFREPWKYSSWLSLTRHIIQHVQNQLLQQKTGYHFDENLRLARRGGETALVLNPVHAPSWNVMGAIFALGGKNHEELRQHCTIRSLQLDPDNNSDGWCNLALLFEERRHFQVARKLLMRAHSVHAANDAAIWTARARIEGKTEANIQQILSALDCAVAEIGEGFGGTVETLACLEFGMRYVLSNEQHENFTPLNWLYIEEIMRRYVRKDRENPIANYIYGLALRARGNTNEAKLFFERSGKFGMLNLVELGGDGICSNIDSEAMRIALARSYLRSNRPEMAKKFLGPQHPILVYQADPTEENISGALKDSPDKFAIAALGMDRLDDARRALQCCMSSAETVSKIQVAGATDKTQYLKALHRAPWSCDLWIKTAEVQLDSLPICLPTNERTVNIVSCSAGVAYTLGMAANDQAMTTRATFVSTSVHYIRNNSSVAFSLAQALFHQMPFNQNSLRLLGYAALALGVSLPLDPKSAPKLRFALVSFEKLVQVKEEGIQGYLDCLAYCLSSMALGNYTDTKAIDFATDIATYASCDRVKSLGLLVLGRMHLFQYFGNKEETALLKSACAYYRKAIECANSPLLWLELGLTLFEYGRFRTAKHCFESAVGALEPDSIQNLYPNSVVHLYLACFLAQTVGITKCLGGLNRVTKMWSKNANLQLLRGWMCLLQGDNKNKKLAATCFKRSLVLDPKNETAERLLGTIG